MKLFVRAQIAVAAIVATMPLSATWLMSASAAGNVTGAQSIKPAASAAAMAEYHHALEKYNEIHGAYVTAASAYWSAIAEKRKTRFVKRARNEPLAIDDYVLTQPPVYTGPPKPVDPSEPKAETPPPPPVPVVADFLNAAMQEYKFVPRRPQSEIEFKRAYAQVAAAAGLTKEQAVRIYGFEASGNGSYDVQAGLEYNKPGARAITTALGYNQLLATNSVELMAESGGKFVGYSGSRSEGAAGRTKSGVGENNRGGASDDCVRPQRARRLGSA